MSSWPQSIYAGGGSPVMHGTNWIVATRSRPPEELPPEGMIIIDEIRNGDPEGTPEVLA